MRGVAGLDVEVGDDLVAVGEHPRGVALFDLSVAQLFGDVALAGVGEAVVDREGDDVEAVAEGGKQSAGLD